MRGWRRFWCAAGLMSLGQAKHLDLVAGESLWAAAVMEGCASDEAIVSAVAKVYRCSIALTAQQGESEATALDLGAQVYLTKPV